MAARGGTVADERYGQFDLNGGFGKIAWHLDAAPVPLCACGGAGGTEQIPVLRLDGPSSTPSQGLEWNLAQGHDDERVYQVDDLVYPLDAG